MPISVIVPTYKSPEILDLCLRSLIEGQIEKNEIIVVVDGTYDYNKEILDKWKNNVYNLILPENQGLSRATNLGVYNASNENILIINDDNIAPSSWDRQLNKIDTNNTVWAPNQIEPISSMFSQFHIKNLGKNSKEFDLKEFWKYEIDLMENRFENNGSTLPIYMKKIDYLRVGGWDENYEQGMVSDWDFFLKCQLSGMKMMRTYNCHFYHFVSLSVNSEKRQKAEQEGHMYAKYKWGSPILHNPINNLKFL